ncbi:11656_t:CDS:2, partial [Dentiscutata heterogama]
MDKTLQNDIKFIFGIGELNERVLMTEVIPFKYSTDYYCIKFPVHLDSNDYKIFGKLVTQNGEPIDIAIKFQSLSLTGFSIIIENFNTNNKKFTDSQVIWMMIRIPSKIGFYSIHTRNIPVLALGSHSFKYENNHHEYKLHVLQELPEASVICLSILYPSLCYGMKFTIQDDNNNGSEISIVINENKRENVQDSNIDNEEEISSEKDDK